MRVSGFGFRVSGFGFRVSGFRFQVLGFGFAIGYGRLGSRVSGALQSRIIGEGFVARGWNQSRDIEFLEATMRRELGC